ncbi:MAG: hypothetical protein AAF471_09435 [Myxococcota bacterium]
MRPPPRPDLPLDHMPGSPRWPREFMRLPPLSDLSAPMPDRLSLWSSLPRPTTWGGASKWTSMLGRGMLRPLDCRRPRPSDLAPWRDDVVSRLVADAMLSAGSSVGWTCGAAARGM